MAWACGLTSAPRAKENFNPSKKEAIRYVCLDSSLAEIDDYSWDQALEWIWQAE